ncbi:MAG: hypothetical protein ACRDTD_12140 [Pseudonocardiaceae bacterium]
MANLHRYMVITLPAAEQAFWEGLFRAMDHFAKQPCALCKVTSNCRYACGRCRAHCTHPPTQRFTGWIRATNGVRTAKSRCLRCGRMDYPGSSLPRGSELFDVCLRDLREHHDVPPCVRCGTDQGTELHHWAPQAIFADANLWPTAPLCRDCHQLWHAAMRMAAGLRLDSPVSAPRGAA